MRVHTAAGCLHLVGRVDVANVADVRLALATAIEAGSGDFYVDVSQLDVADATGLSVVHVNRTVQTLRGLKVLSKARQAIEVVDRKQLEEIAGFDGRYLNMPTNASKFAVQIEEATS